ncbi:hypothetical protein O7635_05930 [Asanoa sp. WMMD1127]|uniref:hypothetical protein n=1 Tax=Asanoa sp. WMMD1127 TaxID=3016107 RepID=UPI0024180AC1|nr:hypothetical protein [Asanoa sp. WMMD1127]MDG4821393.1 hypothetical protein [Asanoa sp. WMMD1127]
MSFSLVVVAIDPNAPDEQVRAMVRRCHSGSHVEGELDDRIVGFYESLRSRYPDSPPHGEDSPWMSMPLDVGIDHVSMQLSYSQCGDAALSLIDELAQWHALTIYDPQDDAVTRPQDVRIPPDPALVATWESLRTPES